jgi:hypothetical protein
MLVLPDNGHLQNSSKKRENHRFHGAVIYNSGVVHVRKNCLAFFINTGAKVRFIFQTGK